ncbi:MAG: redoxin domain-containing protein, partial [Chloroflexota bacterium]
IGGITEDTAGIGGITDDAAGAEIEGEAAAETTELTVGLNVGELAPNFETFTADGEPIALEDLRGQTVLLNFWATWCGPCRIEMPEFQDAYEANREDGFVILAVNNRENAEQVQDFAGELGLTFPLAMDLQGDIQDQYAVFNYPSTFLINEDGTIKSKHFGALSVAQIEDLIAEAVG